MTTRDDLWDTPEEAKRKNFLKRQILEGYLRCRYLINYGWTAREVGNAVHIDLLNRWLDVAHRTTQVLGPAVVSPEKRDEGVKG